jgi:ribA/ribD-fused uncharacterized protein
MKTMLQSYGSLEAIYAPSKQTLCFLPSRECLTRPQLLMLREVLNGEAKERVSGSLLVRETTGRVSLDWGSSRIEVAEEEMKEALRSWLIRLDLTEPQAVYFYELEQYPYGCFSNCAPYGLWLDGRWWCTTEHYFQAQKFVHPGLQAMIGGIASAKDAAKRGRDKSLPLRPDWELVKDDIMYAAVRQKFEIHEDIRQILLATGDQELVEDAPDDYYWGCGADGSGKNKLGQILMQIRAVLRGQEALKKGDAC